MLTGRRAAGAGLYYTPRGRAAPAATRVSVSLTNRSLVQHASGSPRRHAATLGGLLAVALLAVFSLQVSSPDAIWHVAPDAPPGTTLVGPGPGPAAEARDTTLVSRAAAVTAVCLVYLLASAIGTGRVAAAGAALALATSGLFWTRAAGGHEVTVAGCLALAPVGCLIWLTRKSGWRRIALTWLSYGLAAAAIGAIALRPAGNGSVSWRAWLAPHIWTTLTERLTTAASALVSDFGILGLGLLVAGAIALVLDRARWLGAAAVWSLALGTWALASAAPDWQAAMLPATAPLWLVVASGMRWASQPEAGRGRRRAAIALVVLLPALNLATNYRQAGRARAGRDFVQRYVAGLERLEPGAPTRWSASQAVDTAFSVPPGTMALEGAQATLAQLGFRFAPVAGAGVAMTLDEFLSTVPGGWIVALATGDRFALGVRPGGPTFAAIGGTVDLFEVRRNRYLIVGVRGRTDQVIERVSWEPAEVALQAGDALGTALRLPGPIRVVSAENGAFVEYHGRRVASSRTGVALAVVTPSGELAGAHGVEVDDDLRILVDPPSLSAGIASGREPCVDVSPGRWTDVSRLAALASLGGVLSAGQSALVYLGHARPLTPRLVDVGHPGVPSLDVRAYELADPASATALEASRRSDGVDAATDLATYPFVYRVEAVSGTAGRTQLALGLGGFAAAAWARVTPADGADPVAVCAAMRGRKTMFAEWPSTDRAPEELDLGDDSLFVSGWHRLERAGPLDFRWTSSHTAEVLVPVARQSPVMLEIEAASAHPAGTSMQVRVNDADLDRVDLRPDRQVYRWDLPAEAWRVGLNRVQITAADVIRPADLGMSDDERPLGVAISRLRLVPRDPAR